MSGATGRRLAVLAAVLTAIEISLLVAIVAEHLL